MSALDLTKLYHLDVICQSLSELLKPNSGIRIHLKGLVGSLDAVVGVTTNNLNPRLSQLFILHDREEAAYFQNDLQSLLPKKEIYFFPTSYKRPYEFEEIDNANVLQRTEVINHLSTRNTEGNIIVTYPEALSEKVVNKKKLKSATIKLDVGSEVEIDDLMHKLVEFDFQKEDFVYEAGQFALRGGIIDIFSYAYELPYRIELFGREIERIRTFDPQSQLSLEHVKSVGIIPNLQTRFKDKTRQSFLSFMPKNTKIWIKDIKLTIDIIDKYLEKANDSFQSIIEKSNKTQVILDPKNIFESGLSFSQDLEAHDILEFGNRFYYDPITDFTLNSAPQPSFNKNFDRITDNLITYRNNEYSIFIASDSFKQINQLTSIFEEIDPSLKFKSINNSLRSGFIDHDNRILVYTDHQLFERYHKFKSKEKFSKSKALTLNELKSLQTGDYVTHIDYGIGRFNGTFGKISIRKP